MFLNNDKSYWEYSIIKAIIQLTFRLFNQKKYFANN
jgi:hypothetical protein